MLNYNPGSPKWKKYRERFNGLKMSSAARELLFYDPKRFKSYCNGVGSKVGFWGRLTYHLIPNWIWFMSILPQADLHDVDYTIPSEFPTIEAAIKHKQESDSRFFENICIEATRRGGILEDARKRGAWVEYEALKLCGNDSFLAEKTILDNLKY